MTLPNPPKMSDDAGPWLAYPDVIDRIRKERRCSEASAEVWLRKVTVSSPPQLRGRCCAYRLPADHPQWRSTYMRPQPLEAEWVDPLDHLQWGYGWGAAVMRGPWVAEYTEWNEQQVNELLGIASSDIESAIETAQNGRPPDPIRDAVVDGLQPVLDESGGKLSTKEFAFRTRTLAAQNGRSHLPDGTRRDWQKIAKTKWKARKGR